MCESSVYIREDDEEILFFDSADVVRVDGNRVYMRNLFGEEKYYEGELEEVLLSKHKIILRAKDPQSLKSGEEQND